MSLAERLSFLALGLLLTGWLYWLTNLILRVLGYAEQLQVTGARLLALVPSKSAPHTEAPPNQEPRLWWQRLRALPLPTDEEVVAVVEEAEHRRALFIRLRDAMARRASQIPPAAPPAAPPAEPERPEPDTVVDLRKAWEVPPLPVVVEPDDVDRALARFTFAAGHRGSPGHPPDPAELAAADADGGD